MGNCSKRFGSCLHTLESPGSAHRCSAFTGTVRSDSVLWPTYAHLRGQEVLAGFLPGHTCSLCTLAGKFTPGSVLFCSLSDLLKKQTVSKLPFVRKCAMSHLPSKIIPLEFSKQPLPRGPAVCVGASPLFCPPPVHSLCHLRQATGPSSACSSPLPCLSFLIPGLHIGRAWLSSKRYLWCSGDGGYCPQGYSVRSQRG